MQSDERALRLKVYYTQVKDTILTRQNPLTGLLPASTAVNEHGDYTDAWVRDNVYSILAVWGLALAYRKLDDREGHGYELEHSVVKLMRGLLTAMMRQSSKVERFKETQSPLDALHAKYDTKTGHTVVKDDEWGHLQLDATSLFLLMLAQMIESGLSIVYTMDEVNFVQNLVYYIGRTYRTPDYGIWERGNKSNHGNPELNASSLGMAKAALEALNGFNLFGVDGPEVAVIQVLPDEIARSRAALESLLPRESSSKEVDGALLSIISFPAFAIDNPELRDRTREKIIDKLEGKYGCKRFLRDGHQTVVEDSSRLHYEASELKQFEHIECEWPLFFTYLLLDAVFRGDRTAIQKYRQDLQRVSVQRDNVALLPEVYFVPEDLIEAERDTPQSQPRSPNDNVPLVWAQSLYYLGELLCDGLLELGDIDPMGRHLQGQVQQSPVVQIALIAENATLQTQLAAFGIQTQTPEQVAPIQIRPAKDLGRLFTQIGRNEKLGLTGRPRRRMRGLTTSRIFRIQGQTVVFLPAIQDQQQFYLTIDPHFLVSQIRSELPYIQRHWNLRGRPTISLWLSHNLFQNLEDGDGDEPMLVLLRELQDGHCGDVSVITGRLNQLILRACVVRIENIEEADLAQLPSESAALFDNYLPFRLENMTPLSGAQELSLEQEEDTQSVLRQLRETDNLYEQVEILEALVRLEDVSFDTGLGDGQQVVTVAALLEEVYDKAIEYQQWGIMRWVAGLNEKVVPLSLADAVTDILARQKQIAVGRAYSSASLISAPLSPQEILAKIKEFCRVDARDRILTQEMLIYLSLLLKAEPTLFDGLLTIRVGYLILLLTSEIAQERSLPQDEAYEFLLDLSPHNIQRLLQDVMQGYDSVNLALMAQESLTTTQNNIEIDWVVLPDEADSSSPEPEDWQRKRELDGAINRVPEGFYPKVWNVLRHCRGLVIGDKLERRNRLESDPLLSEMTAGETNFALKVEHLLNKIASPMYRQVNIECLVELSAIADKNPDFQIKGYIVLDILIGHAVRLFWLKEHPDHAGSYADHKAEAWQQFYQRSPYDCASYIVKALQFLTHTSPETAAV